MKGYVFLTAENNLQIRNLEYIENENPNFFGENGHWVISYWQFDSEDPSFENILDSLRRARLQEEDVRTFCNAVNFNLDLFLERKKVQRQKST